MNDREILKHVVELMETTSNRIVLTGIIFAAYQRIRDLDEHPGSPFCFAMAVPKEDAYECGIAFRSDTPRGVVELIRMIADDNSTCVRIMDVLKSIAPSNRKCKICGGEVDCESSVPYRDGVRHDTCKPTGASPD